MAKFLVSKYCRPNQTSSKHSFGWHLMKLLKLSDEIKTIHQIAGESLKEPVLNLKNKTPFVLPKSTILSTLAKNTDVGLNKQMNVTKISNNLEDDSNFLDGSQSTALTRRKFSNSTDKKRCRKAIPCKKKRRRPKKSDACKRDPDDVCARQAAFKCFDKCAPKPVKKTKTSMIRSKKVSCSPLCLSAEEAKKSGKCKKSVPCKDKEELERIKLMKAKDDSCKKNGRCPTERDDPCKPKDVCKEPCPKKKMEPCKVVRGDPCKTNEDSKCK